jgi:hypothetical protein
MISLTALPTALPVTQAPTQALSQRQLQNRPAQLAQVLSTTLTQLPIFATVALTTHALTATMDATLALVQAAASLA